MSALKWYRNIFVVWMFTGFWHGASWNFIIWGLYFGVLLVIEKKWLLGILEKAKGIKHIYVLLLLIISFVIFNAADMTQAMEDIRCMFGFGGLPVMSAEAVYYLRSYGVTLLLAMMGATPVAVKLFTALQCKIGTWENMLHSTLYDILQGILHGIKVMGTILLLILCTAYLVDGSFNPFLYFRF